MVEGEEKKKKKRDKETEDAAMKIKNRKGWEKQLSGRGETHKDRRREEKRGREERYQGGRGKRSLLKRTGLEMQRMSSSSFFFAILLRNLWVICCRGKTFCLPPLKKQA